MEPLRVEFCITFHLHLLMSTVTYPFDHYNERHGTLLASERCQEKAQCDINLGLSPHLEHYRLNNCKGITKGVGALPHNSVECETINLATSCRSHHSMRWSVGLSAGDGDMTRRWPVYWPPPARGGPAHSTRWAAPATACLNGWPARKRTTRRAGMAAAAPGLGLRPGRKSA